jgi:aspartyl-tRNA(Asn)/glutamyl-tRNA(Gln) amidotransferase subunit A
MGVSESPDPGSGPGSPDPASLPGPSDPSSLTIAQARGEIRARRLSATELTTAVLARVEALNPRVNAYLHVRAEAALDEARALDARGEGAPLLGIPICVKDVIDVAGAPTTAGASGWRRDPARDATVVARLRSAGAIVIGKGHTNEFAYGIDGQNPHWGDCRNPHDEARITGGSSSGPAAATVAGMALGGLGTDTSGSIRVPASLCGLVGVRPTLGHVSREGVLPLTWTYDCVGPLTRSAADAAIVLEVLTGAAVRADDELNAHGMRLGVMEQLLDGVEPYVATAVIETARRLESLGARVTTLRFEMLRHVNAIHQVIQHAEAAQIHRPWFADQRSRYSEPVRLRLEAGRLLPGRSYLAAQQARRLLIDEVATMLYGIDAMLAPSTPFVAPPRGAAKVQVRGATRDLRAALLSGVLAPTELGCPVASVPIGSHDGLPFGIQIIGRPRSEALLLRIARECESRAS